MKTLLTALMLMMGLLAGCETAPESEVDKENLGLRVRATIARFKDTDETMAKWFDTAYGYAVFPSVGKGGLVVGGAYGRGQLFEQGRMVGYCDLSQGTVGAQIGGQSYSEVIFFENKAAVEEFKSGDFALAAQASAVAAKAGASADADYEHGVAVFTLARGGLMAEASVGGQAFTFKPK